MLHDFYDMKQKQNTKRSDISTRVAADGGAKRVEEEEEKKKKLLRCCNFLSPMYKTSQSTHAVTWRGEGGRERGSA